jgi:hypothetical protein
LVDAMGPNLHRISIQWFTVIDSISGS